MAKLTLRFENEVLQETLVGLSGVKIGRSPDNGIVIDNLGVSHHHARLFTNREDILMLEDLDSLNGTFVNGRRVKTAALKPGDSVKIGKHTIFIEDSPEMRGFLAWKPAAKPVAPKVEETVMFAAKDKAELRRGAAGARGDRQEASARRRVPVLLVKKGRTNEKEYKLTDMLTVIGKSPMATVQLRGWFAPKVAAQINRRENNAYFLGAAGRVPRVNGERAVRPVKLSPGDTIHIAGVQFEFGYQDQQGTADGAAC